MSNRTIINQIWEGIDSYTEACTRMKGEEMIGEKAFAARVAEERVVAARKLEQLFSKLEDEIEAKIVKSLIKQLEERIK